MVPPRILKCLSYSLEIPSQVRHIGDTPQLRHKAFFQIKVLRFSFFWVLDKLVFFRLPPCLLIPLIDILRGVLSTALSSRLGDVTNLATLPNNFGHNQVFPVLRSAFHQMQSRIAGGGLQDILLLVLPQLDKNLLCLTLLPTRPSKREVIKLAFVYRAVFLLPLFLL